MSKVFKNDTNKYCVYKYFCKFFQFIQMTNTSCQQEVKDLMHNGCFHNVQNYRSRPVTSPPLGAGIWSDDPTPEDGDGGLREGVITTWRRGWGSRAQISLKGPTGARDEYAQMC